MKRMFTIALVGVLTAALAGWVALAAAQQTPGKMPDNPATGSPSDAPDKMPAPSSLAPPASGQDSAATETKPLPGIKPAGSDAPAPQPVSGPPAAASGTESTSLPGMASPGKPAPMGEDKMPEADGPSGRQEPAMSMEWIGAPVAKVGQAGDYSLVVRNTCAGPVQQVVARVRVPAGMKVESTEPKANMENGVLVWELGTMTPRQEKAVTMKLIAEGKGDLMPQAWVAFTGSTVLRVQVREPKLGLKVQVPEKALVGDPAAFTLTVTNPGDCSADQVKIQATLSEGL